MNFHRLKVRGLQCTSTGVAQMKTTSVRQDVSYASEQQAYCDILLDLYEAQDESIVGYRINGILKYVTIL